MKVRIGSIVGGVFAVVWVSIVGLYGLSGLIGLLTGEIYQGVHGTSRRLIGMDPTDDNAMDRAIVIHTAPYAEAAMIPQQGKLGRSDGCFVFGAADLATVLARLGQGRLIYAGRAPI